jgi:hypothetical protein
MTPLPIMARRHFAAEPIAIIGVGCKLPCQSSALFLLQRLALEMTRYRETEKLSPARIKPPLILIAREMIPYKRHSPGLAVRPRRQ